jgi:hypothetical protein
VKPEIGQNDDVPDELKAVSYPTQNWADAASTGFLIVQLPVVYNRPEPRKEKNKSHNPPKPRNGKNKTRNRV